jgi:hypothetical protein
MKYSVVVAVLGLAAVASPQTAFAYGINMSESGNPLRWDRDTVAFRMDPELETSLPAGTAFGAVSMGFEAWRGLPRVPDLVLQPGKPEKAGHHGGERATNGVYLVRDWKGEPDQLAITVVTYNRSTGEIFDADILVNANASYQLLDESAPVDGAHYDLGAILTHEAGHSLGLDESETHPEATMWPLVSPGETHQRTLAEDDEQGVITNYAGSVPDAALGCGPSSVLGRPGEKSDALLSALLVLAAGLWLARTVRRQNLARRTLAFGLGSALIVAPGVGSAPAAGDEHADHAVASAAHGHGRGPRAAVPGVWLPESDPAARVRIARAFGPAAATSRLVRGHAKARASAWKDGFIVTEHAVREASGAEHRFEVRGGTVGELSQRWIHDAPPPADGDEIVLGTDDSGRTGWAHYQGGLIFGGSLGHGPAIRIAN